MRPAERTRRVKGLNSITFQNEVRFRNQNVSHVFQKSINLANL